ncbi:hypothetical protein GCM10023169_10870 [Georgenia halophila]|uniref:Uncharacterized protein n=1 Tax=Georgenia halophila TaxID=620889 RepID=A0ABP8L1G3_9MICO
MAKADHRVGLRAESGQDDDRDVAAGAQLFAHVQPVDAGQHQVQDHQVVGQAGHRPQRGLAVARLHGFVTLCPDVGRRDLAHRRVVVDHEDPGHQVSLEI